MKKYLTPFLFTVSLLPWLNSCGDIEPFEPGVNTNLIQKESNLYSHLQLVSEVPEAQILNIGCIEFIFPFVIRVYDENDLFINTESILDNQGFIDLLSRLQDGFAISLSYPIKGTLADGTPLWVSSNEELESSLTTCIEENFEMIIAYASSILQECRWEVTESSLEGDPYLNSTFSMEEDGTVVFDYGDETIGGTWIFYYIGEDLHLNIFIDEALETEPTNLDDPQTVSEDWNFDWQVLYIDDVKISIQNNADKRYTLTQVCEEENAKN